MHEMSIASEIFMQVERLAAEHGAQRVESVDIEAGSRHGIVPEALETAWAALCEGTVAEGSALRYAEVATRARCRDCGSEFTPAVDDYVCPECGHADVEFTEGYDILLKSLELETPDE